MSRVIASNSIADFNAIRLTVASPEDVLRWSNGEVMKPEQSIIELKNQNAMDCSVNVFLVQSKTLIHMIIN